MLSATSGFRLDDFAHRKGQVNAHLAIIKDVAAALGQMDAVRAIEQTQQELLEERFRVVVLGEFSRGKSTLINALLGERVLPASVNPTTAIINVIQYSKTPSYTLCYRNGAAPRSLTADEFRKVVAPPEPIPGDELSVRQYEEAKRRLAEIDRAEIGYPTPFCKEGVEIVDTPGTNDMDPLREAITYGFIPQSDAAIFVLAATQPLSESEMGLLRDRILPADIRRIFFVVNFRDRLGSVEDEQRVLSYIRRHLETVVSDPRLFLVSAKQALAMRRLAAESSSATPVGLGQSGDLPATGIPEFENVLADFLNRERASAKLEKHVTRGIRLAEELARHMRTRFAVLGVEVEKLSDHVKQLELEVERARAEKNRVLNALRVSLENGGFELRNHLRRGLENIAGVAREAVASYTGVLDPKALARAIESAVAPHQTRLQQRMQSLQETLLRDEVAQATRRLDEVWVGLEKTVLQQLESVAPIEDSPLLKVLWEGTEQSIYNVSLIGAGLGAVVAVLQGTSIFTAGPIALLGGVALARFFTSLHRERVLAEVQEKVDARYSSVVPGMLANFDTHWKLTCDRIVQLLDEDMSRRIGQLTDTLREAECRRLQALADDEAERTRLSDLERRLATSVRALAAFAQTGE